MKSRKAIDFQLPTDSNSLSERLADLPADQLERMQTIRDMKRRGLTNAQIARLLKIGEATVYRDLQRLRELYTARTRSLSLAEELGHGLELFDEIIDKSMEGARSALEDNEQDGPDHAHANRYLATAATVKKQKLDLIIEIGATQMLNRALERNVDPHDIDVSALKTKEDFQRAEEAITREIREVQRKLH